MSQRAYVPFGRLLPAKRYTEARAAGPEAGRVNDMPLLSRYETMGDGRAAGEAGRAAGYRPPAGNTAARSASARSVRSQEKSGSVRPKWP